MSVKRKIKGQGMTEYVIIVAVIAIAALGMFKGFGAEVSTKMKDGTATVKALKMTGGS